MMPAMCETAQTAPNREPDGPTAGNRSTPANWKDIVELVGVVAIVASLLFVGVEMRQTRNIAVSDGEKAYASIVITTQGLVNDHAEVWIKGNSGDELNKVESAIYANLIAARMEALFVGWLSLVRLGEEESAETLLIDFTGFLHRNPGARRVWYETEMTLDEYRKRLHPDGNRFIGFFEKIKNDLDTLDRLDPEP